MVAGLVAIAAFILLLLYSRSRTMHDSNLVRRTTEIDPEPKLAPLQAFHIPRRKFIHRLVLLYLSRRRPHSIPKRSTVIQIHRRLSSPVIHNQLPLVMTS